jgi:thymidylate synthase (FAD)
VVPPAIVDKPYQWTWEDACNNAMLDYRTLSNNLMEELSHIEDKTARRKAAREAARSVLPNCVATKIVVTANARAWRHMLELRGDGSADAEIRRLAVAVLAKLAEASPNLFGEYNVTDGVIVNERRKV